MIWKFVVPLDRAGVEMSRGAVLLHVAGQDDDICVWADVDPDSPLESRDLYVVPTGSAPGAASKYVGTGHLHNGGFVGHVFEAW